VKTILDEDAPHKLRLHLPGSVTVAHMGWSGMKNGELLKAAEEAGFEVLITGDQSMPQEQNMSGRKLALVTLSYRMAHHQASCCKDRCCCGCCEAWNDHAG